MATPGDAAQSVVSAPVEVSSTAGKPDCYVVVSNVAKRHNIGTLMRSCVAFGVKEIIVTGTGRVQTFGAQGTERFSHVRTFPKAKDAVTYLKALGVTICGIEITPDAQSIETHPFRGPTAFLAGNEGDGLCEAHKALCDHFVYIPQYGNGTASLNVTIASSIILHHFALWAGYVELAREAGKDKYAVAAPALKDGSCLSEGDLALRAERAAKRARVQGGEGAGGGEDEEESGERRGGSGEAAGGCGE